MLTVELKQQAICCDLEKCLENTTSEVKSGNHTLTVRITKDGIVPVVGITLSNYFSVQEI